MVEKIFCDMCGPLQAEASGSVNLYDKDEMRIAKFDLCEKHFIALQKFLKKVPEKP